MEIKAIKKDNEELKFTITTSTDEFTLICATLLVGVVGINSEVMLKAKLARMLLAKSDQIVDTFFAESEKRGMSGSAKLSPLFKMANEVGRNLEKYGLNLSESNNPEELS